MTEKTKTLDEYVREVVDRAPPLSPEQVARLAVLLGASTHRPVKNKA